MMVYQFGIVLFSGATFGIGTAAALVVLIAGLWLLLRPTPKNKRREMARAATAAR